MRSCGKKATFILKLYCKQWLQIKQQAYDYNFNNNNNYFMIKTRRDFGFTLTIRKIYIILSLIWYFLLEELPITDQYGEFERRHGCFYLSEIW